MPMHIYVLFVYIDKSTDAYINCFHFDFVILFVYLTFAA